MKLPSQVFEYLTGAALFELYESSTITLSDVHLERMIELLGPFPQNVLDVCSGRDKYFNRQGEHFKLLPTCTPNLGSF
jgi:serine/threonine-protein kinase SRPK3